MDALATCYAPKIWLRRQHEASSSNDNKRPKVRLTERAREQEGNVQQRRFQERDVESRKTVKLDDLMNATIGLASLEIKIFKEKINASAIRAVARDTSKLFVHYRSQMHCKR